MFFCLFDAANLRHFPNPTMRLENSDLGVEKKRGSTHGTSLYKIVGKAQPQGYRSNIFMRSCCFFSCLKYCELWKI